MAAQPAGDWCRSDERGSCRMTLFPGCSIDIYVQAMEVYISKCLKETLYILLRHPAWEKKMSHYFSEWNTSTSTTLKHLLENVYRSLSLSSAVVYFFSLFLHLSSDNFASSSTILFFILDHSSLEKKKKSPNIVPDLYLISSAISRRWREKKNLGFVVMRRFPSHAFWVADDLSQYGGNYST